MTEPAVDSPVGAAPARRPPRRWGRWLLGALAFAAIARVVPLHDRCESPAAPGARFEVTREGGRCFRHEERGARPLPTAECAALRCEAGVVTTLRGTRPSRVALWAALYVVASVTWAFRWRALLPLAGLRLPVLPVWRTSLESMAASALVPTAVSADAVRAASMKARGAPVAQVLATILLDRLVGLGALLAVAFALVAASGETPPRWRFTLGAALAAIVAGVVTLSRGWILRLRWLMATAPGRMLAPALEAAGAPGAGRALGVAVGWALAVAAINFAIIRALVAELGGTPTGEGAFFLRVALIFVSTVLPGVPGSWEATWVFLLGGAGVAPSVALGACMLLRLYTWLLAALGAVSIAAGGRTRAPAESLVPPGRTG